MIASAASTPATDLHIVDQLIEERCQKIRRTLAWPLFRSILYPILGYKQAVKMADAIAPLEGADVFEYLSRLLDLNIEVKGLEHLPKSGRVLVAMTHPTGIPDGVAVWDAISPIRDDITFFANRDATRVAPNLDEMIIPVEWVEERRTRARSRETLQGVVRAFTGERCVVLFPSGRIAFMNDEKKLVEQEWLNSVAIFARKYDSPIVPAHIVMRNSWLYYWFWDVNTELRDITLFHELLNKAGKTFEIIFGPPIPASDLRGDPNEVTAALRVHAMKEVAEGQPWKPFAPRNPDKN